VTVQDDGNGFDPRQEKGMGLLGMEERIEQLGGLFHIEFRTWTRDCVVDYGFPSQSVNPPSRRESHDANHSRG
jgi:glucose-6-phosphate-specific signal transduction histidine kinase